VEINLLTNCIFQKTAYSLAPEIENVVYIGDILPYDGGCLWSLMAEKFVRKSPKSIIPNAY
jgi:hypothetical protein